MNTDRADKICQIALFVNELGNPRPINIHCREFGLLIGFLRSIMLLRRFLLMQWCRNLLRMCGLNGDCYFSMRSTSASGMLCLHLSLTQLCKEIRLAF